MNSSETEDDICKLRIADIKTGVVLLILSVAILIETFTFPMTDSWGGVENVWYVSPALFPLIVGSALLILSLVLLSTGIKEFKALDPNPNRWKRMQPNFTLLATQKNRDTLYIIGLLIFYIYILIPFSDFF